MTPTLRRATVADVPLVVDISIDAFDPAYGEAWTGPQLTAALLDGHSWAELAYMGDDPAGFALVRRIADEAELLLVAVRPRWRRHGIATRLIEAATVSARAAGASILFLEVRDGNDAASRLYQRLGFTSVGRRKHYYGGPRGARFDAVTMRRDLETAVVS